MSFQFFGDRFFRYLIISLDSFALGIGQGLVRLLQFSGILASDSLAVRPPFLPQHSNLIVPLPFFQKLQLSYWDHLVDDYFTSRAIMKFTLWKDSQRNEAKLFGSSLPFPFLCALEIMYPQRSESPSSRGFSWLRPNLVSNP